MSDYRIASNILAARAAAVLAGSESTARVPAAPTLRVPEPLRATQRGTFRADNKLALSTLRQLIPNLDKLLPSSMRNTPGDLKLEAGDVVTCAGQTWREELRIPADVDAHLVGGCLVLVDTKAANRANSLVASFAARHHSDVGLHPDVMVIHPSVFSQSDGSRAQMVHWDLREQVGLAIGCSRGSSADSFQEAIEVFREKLHERDFASASTDLDLGGRRLRVSGPNRDGEYRLAAKPPIFLTRDGELRLGESWSHHAVIESSDLATGSIVVVSNPEKKPKHQTILLQFGNDDANESAKTHSGLV